MNNTVLEEKKVDEMLAFFAELERNIEDESAARRGYYTMFLKFRHLMSKEEVDLIEEIIAEELKHTNILSEMIYRRNKIEPET